MLQFVVTAAPFGAGAIAALGVAFLNIRLARGRSRADHSAPLDPSRESEVFVLRSGSLVSANFAGRRRLDRIGPPAGDLDKLRRLLDLRFEGAAAMLAEPGPDGDMGAISRDGKLQILREVAGMDVRLEISPRTTGQRNGRDISSLDAEAEELRLLRANTEVAPFLLWRENRQGEVVWANRSYVDAATGIFGEGRVSVWPMPSIFEPFHEARKCGACASVRRVRSAPDADGASGWYDCHVSDIDGETLCTAFPADEAVRSEARYREFTQTLTKTFSDLAIGLAIFDRSRRLALFNPAVTDLTALPVDFLTSRPSLVTFLDQLREKRVMPEPRDYKAWRRSIADLESAAMDGTYSETWSLPDGRTYRVSGRPHPDGAMALLFEDISAEMSLTRRFRAQIEQSQSIIDALDEAVAIFSATGELTFANAAYNELWSEVSDSCILGTSVLEATRRWHEVTVPTPVWGDFRDFAFQNAERDEWTADVTMRDGRNLTCRFVPHKAGASLAIFQIRNSGKTAVPALTRAAG